MEQLNEQQMLAAMALPASYANKCFLVSQTDAPGIVRLAFIDEMNGQAIPRCSIIMTVDAARSVAAVINRFTGAQ